MTIENLSSLKVSSDTKKTPPHPDFKELVKGKKKKRKC